MNTVLHDAEEHIGRLMARSLPPGTLYHTLEHTRETVDAAREIAEESGLGSEDLEAVLLAAWFHDAGYVEGPDGHEERSMAAAREFLARRGFPEERIRAVEGCILATRVPQQPSTTPEKVLADADMVHLGKKRFFAKADLMRREFELRSGRSFTEEEWLGRNIDFIATHEYHTPYARREFSTRRLKNLMKLRERLAALRSDEPEGGAAMADAKDAKRERRELDEQGKQKEKGGGKEKERLPERGIETMFRTVPRNHLDLSAMADAKANILLSTSMIIISITFGLLANKLDANPHLIAPTVLLLAVCLATMVLAILTTRPNVAEGRFTREDIRQKKVNLLFFGNFHGTELEDFEWGMKEMMRDREYLYGSMIRDLYALGKVLGRKYRHLRLAYTVFMWGMIAVVAAFVVAFLNAPDPLAPIS